MADGEIDYSAYAGRVAFPRSPQDLLSTTTCPACFAILKSTVCSVCGLDLGHPAAVELHDASLATAAALDKRLAIIGRMRYETEQAANLRWAAGQEAARGAAAIPASVVAPGASAREEIAVPAVSTSSTGDNGGSIRDTGVPAVSTLREPQGDPGSTGDNGGLAGDVKQRRSSVQVTLLVVGVSLLSVAAIFFLVYAFINFGIVWRSVIIGAITVAAFVVATLLRRRTLTATAEGIAVFAVVLVYLDVWAIRANDLFGAGATDATLYWGIALVLAAIGFIVWHRMSGLRVANIAGFATFAPSVGVLVSGLTEPHMTAFNEGFLSATAIAIAGLIHPLARHAGKPALPERIIVLATTAIALLGAFILAIRIYERFEWATAIGGVGLAVLAGVHVALLQRSPSAVSASFGHIFAAFAGFSAASAVGLVILRGGDEDAVLIVPAVSAAVVALLLELCFRRIATTALRPFAATASIGATVIAGIALAPALLMAFGRATQAAASGIRDSWNLAVTDPVTVLGTGGTWPILALALVGALTALAWWIGHALPARNPVIAWWAALVLVLAVPSLRILWLEFGAWMLIAAAGLAALILVRGRTGAARYRPVLLATMVVAAVLGYLLGWATTATWWVGTLVVLGILIASRALVTSTVARTALLGAATALTLLSVGSVAAQATLGANTGLQVELTNRVVLTGVVAVVILLLSALRNRLLSGTDRRVVFWIAGAVSAISLASSTTLATTVSSGLLGPLLLPEFATSLVVAVLLLAALALWVALPSNRSLRPERIAASIAVAPALYLLVTAFVRVLGLPAFVDTVAPITAALLAAAGALVITTLRPSTTPRWARELSVALVAVPALFSSMLRDDGLAWLVLLIAAVTALLLAIDSDGLFSSASPRRHLGWLALALATVGLWWRLSGDEVTDLWLYVVPLSLALLLVAGFIGRAGERATPPQESRVAPLVALAGLLVTILPLGVNAATGPLGEAVILFAVSAILLLVGSAIVGTPKWQWNADASALAGAIGAIVIAVGRASFLPIASLGRDGWLATAFLVLIIAAFLQARPHVTGNAQVRSTVSQWLVLVAMTAVLALEVGALGTDPTGAIRTLAVVLLFAALHVVAYFADRAPLTSMLAWVAIAYSAIAAVVGVTVDAIHPVEIVTVPIALALLVTGASHLATVPMARSWPWLAPGTVMLLLPSLVATIDERPVWRLVGLGVVGIAIIVIAVVRRLQAPFVIGVVVVLWHGVATFLPQLRAAYAFFPWWLWLGLGGVLLIVLAARYEQRIRNLKSVAMRFAALR